MARRFESSPAPLADIEVRNVARLGPDIAFFYNNAYRPTLGNKRPNALAVPTKVLYAEIWDDVSTQLDFTKPRLVLSPIAPVMTNASVCKPQ